MKKVYDNNLQDKSNKITFLPTDKIVSEISLIQREELSNSLQQKIKYYPRIIEYLDNLDYIVK
ncbi:MAG: hypothetical protein LN567_06155 [Rickettsia endosymbiont of Graphium doson]|nr:hypothetical protein [Rickettsia endosymbiont of Graphium doson]